jgi:hypothetical protein
VDARLNTIASGLEHRTLECVAAGHVRNGAAVAHGDAKAYASDARSAGGCESGLHDGVDTAGGAISTSNVSPPSIELLDLRAVLKRHLLLVAGSASRRRPQRAGRLDGAAAHQT